jgi:hypothetical protein
LTIHLAEVYDYEEKDIVVMMDGVGDDHLEPNSETLVSSKECMYRASSQLTY